MAYSNREGVISTSDDHIEHEPDCVIHHPKVGPDGQPLTCEEAARTERIHSHQLLKGMR